jgi:hypothetical protein
MKKFGSGINIPEAQHGINKHFLKMLCARNPKKLREMYRRENKEVKRMKQK